MQWSWIGNPLSQTINLKVSEESYTAISQIKDLTWI